MSAHPSNRLHDLGRLSFASGMLVLALAIAWWWIAFAKVTGAGLLSLSESTQCAAFTSGMCDLALSLCRADHIFDVRWYSPAVLWSGLSLLALGAILARWNRTVAAG